MILKKADIEIAQLDEKLFSSPALAISGAASAISDMAKTAMYNLEATVKCLKTYDVDEIDKINENEDLLDILTDKISLYLVQLAHHTPTGTTYDKLNFYAQCIPELE